MHTDEYLTDSGAINLESGGIQTFYVTCIFLSACEEKSDKQICSANKSSHDAAKRSCEQQLRPSAVK